MLQRALELQPHNAAAHHCLGAAMFLRGDFDGARICHGRAIELDPNMAEAHNGLGIAWMEEGRLDEALESFDRALELQAGYATASSESIACAAFARAIRSRVAGT